MTFSAKKKFGQNFLKDQLVRSRVLGHMKSLVDFSKAPLILEIGPGQGDLTKEFVTWSREVMAIEIDPEAVGFLQAQFPETSNFQLVPGDGYRMIQDGKTPEDFVFLSSLPYNLGSRMLVDLAITRPWVNIAVIVQKEVASKARPSSKFTLFGAWLNWFWNCSIAMDLSPRAFVPQPKIWSSLLIGKSKFGAYPYLQTQEQRTRMLEILKLLFANPKKTLANNLKHLEWGRVEIDDFLKYNSYDPQIRLTFENYQQICHHIFLHDSHRQGYDHENRESFNPRA